MQPTGPRIPHPARIAVYGALAVGLYTVENLIPSPLPWLRVGVANVAVVLALYDIGARGAVSVFLLKLVLGSVLAGRFLTPFFWFAAIGGGASLCAMLLVRAVAGRWVSAVGTSAVGGAVHSLAQLAVARVVLVRSDAIWVLAPLLGVLGVVTGTFVGITARLVRIRLERQAMGPGDMERPDKGADGLD
jgi:heptaprenyl diphosphate synthase